MNLDGSDAETAEELESLLLAGLVGKVRPGRICCVITFSYSNYILQSVLT